MSNNTIDLLQIKIERAKEKLPETTLNAIAAVDWKAAILRIRETKGYSFEQLGDLELETELLLCGLLPPNQYTKQLEEKMKISRAAANELVNEMNEMVFKKIKEELVKTTERKKDFQQKQKMGKMETAPSDSAVTDTADIDATDTGILQSAGIEFPVVSKFEDTAQPKEEIVEEDRGEMLKKMENPELIKPLIHPLLEQKILGQVQLPTTKTEHIIENISKNPNNEIGINKTSAEIHETKNGSDKTTSKTSYPKNGDPYRLPPEL